MSVKFELGPRQREWIAALRSGEYVQCKGFLTALVFADQTDDCGVRGYCCLGVALYHCKLGRERNSQYLESTFREIGLYDGHGTPQGTLHAEDVTVGTLESLAEMNDDGVPFQAIADIIEKYPDRYFAKSV